MEAGSLPTMLCRYWGLEDVGCLETLGSQERRGAKGVKELTRLPFPAESVDEQAFQREADD